MAGLRGIGRRPTLWIELAVAAGWLALILGEGIAHGYGGGSRASLAGGPLWICMTGLGGIGHAAAHGSAPPMASGSLVGATPMWGLMALAMMTPTAMPVVQHVSGKSLYWRRRRAASEFLAVFLALWTAFAAVALGPLGSWPPAGSTLALPVVLAAAALWQLTPLKLAALRACHRSHPLPPHGWRASRGVADFALRNGSACIASCWAMMAAAAISGSARLLWMAVLTAAMTVEKLSEKPRTASRRLAALLAAAAIGTAAVLLP
ncbi:MAG TPA: DUF2182 domain-containing protein [Solirubrobacterales bacterium]|nr:DUF2182 domain-containing protein [Solirubrobacterales bacterium]